jgi:hypothetical protein
VLFERISTAKIRTSTYQSTVSCSQYNLYLSGGIGWYYVVAQKQEKATGEGRKTVNEVSELPVDNACGTESIATVKTY